MLTLYRYRAPVQTHWFPPGWILLGMLVPWLVLAAIVWWVI